MNTGDLSPAILSLIHHVELNKAGWWDRTVQQFILAELFRSTASLSIEELQQGIATSLRRQIDSDFLDKQIDALEKAGHLVALPAQGFRLAEGARTRMQSAAASVDDNARAVEQRFRDEVERRGIEIDAGETWTAFSSQVLSPMVQDLGARTYQVLSGADLRQESSDYLGVFLKRFPAEYHTALTEVAIAVLDPRNETVRSYILRQLNTRFVVEAAGLPRQVLEQLGRDRKGHRQRVLLFLDTNFLFSLLQLHANPANEAAEALSHLLKQVHDFIDVQLYVLPNTLDEARHRIGTEIDRLRHLVLTPKLAQAVRAGEVSGLAQRYIQEVAKGTVRMRPEEFFGPYHDDLLSFARARGVELYNVRIEDVERSQAVIDDTLDREKFEKVKYGDKAKSYEQLLHDVAAWHLCRSKRPGRIDSPLEAGAWVVTVDYRLLGFDRHKLKAARSQIPVCVHPAVLTQLLQFWVPRSPEFEQALVASMRLPFFFNEFDPEAERVTVRILGTLGRFQNVDKLPEQTIANVLASQALRQRLAGPATVEEQIQAVESALVEENSRLEERMKREFAKRIGAERAIREKEAAIITKEATVEELSTRVQTGEQRILALSSEIEGLRDHANQTNALNRFQTHTVIPILGVAATIIGVSVPLIARSQLAAGPLIAGTVALVVFTAIVLIVHKGRRITQLEKSRAFTALVMLRRWAWIGLGVVLAYVIGELFGQPIVDTVRAFVSASD